MKTKFFLVSAIIVSTMSCKTASNSETKNLPFIPNSNTPNSFQSGGRQDSSFETAGRQPTSFRIYPDRIVSLQNQVQQSNAGAYRMLGILAQGAAKNRTVTPRLITNLSMKFSPRNSGVGVVVHPVITGQTEDEAPAVEELKSFHTEVGLNEDAITCAQWIASGEGECD